MTTHTKVLEVAHTGKVWCVEIVDKWLVSCGPGEKAIRFWSLQNGEEVTKLKLSGECRNFELNSKRTRMAVAHNSGVEIWDFASRKRLKEIKTNDSVNDVRFNESGTKLIIGEYSGQVSKVDL